LSISRLEKATPHGSFERRGVLGKNFRQRPVLPHAGRALKALRVPQSFFVDLLSGRDSRSFRNFSVGLVVPHEHVAGGCPRTKKTTETLSVAMSSPYRHRAMMRPVATKWAPAATPAARFPRAISPGKRERRSTLTPRDPAAANNTIALPPNTAVQRRSAFQSTP